MKFVLAIIGILFAVEALATDFIATIADTSGIAWARARQNLLAKGLHGDQNGQIFDTDAAYFEWFMQQQALRMKQQKMISDKLQ